MRELSFEEIQEVSGGYSLFLNVVGGVMGNIVYHGLGGLEGISSMISDANDYLTDMAYNIGDAILANPDGHGYMD
jgi:hypothetical protein